MSSFEPEERPRRIGEVVGFVSVVVVDLGICPPSLLLIFGIAGSPKQDGGNPVVEVGMVAGFYGK